MIIRNDICRTHCCVKHGCKYNKDNCCVINGLVIQKYLCQDCVAEGIISIEELYKSNRKLLC